jgi:hypothetical protein
MVEVLVLLLAGCRGPAGSETADTSPKPADDTSAGADDTSADTDDTSADTSADTDSDDTPADTAPDDTAADTAIHPAPIELVFVVDITGSWSRANFAAMRDGLVAALDAAESRGVAGDKVALVSFHGRYAEVLAPWLALDDASAVADARVTWSALETASKGGVARPFPDECSLRADSPPGANSARNDFTTGGCYPDMPREYTDEAGTDHTTGLTLAGQLFAETPAAGGALILVTDGIPNGPSSASGQYRAERGYIETRWEEYQGPVPHTSSAIQAESPLISAALYADEGVESWVLSYIVDAPWLDAIATGRGTSQTTATAEELGAALPAVVAGL